MYHGVCRLTPDMIAGPSGRHLLPFEQDSHTHTHASWYKVKKLFADNAGFKKIICNSACIQTDQIILEAAIHQNSVFRQS